jgi:sugar phosphate isomerase/epimerase
MRDLSDRLDLLAINTATFGHQWPIEKTIDLLAERGVGGIAPWRREIEDADIDVGDAARRIKGAGLTVTGYCRSSYLTGATETARAAAIDDNKRALDTAAAIGARCYIMVMGSVWDGSRDLKAARAQAFDGTAALLDHAREVGVPLALEPLHPMTAGDRSCLSTLAQALDWCETLDPDRSGVIGVAADIYHIWWDPDLDTQIARAGPGRLLGYHICDWLVPTRDLVTDRGMMGDGVVDLKAIRGEIEAAGYTGHCEAEIFSAENWWKRDPAETLDICIERFRNVV